MADGMDREQVLAYFAAYSPDEDDGEPVFLPLEVLEQVTSADIPAGVIVEVGFQHGSVIDVAWNGRFFRDEDGSLRVSIFHDISPKYWPEAVGARFYLDLLRKCVLSKLDSPTGLTLDDFDDSDDVVIRLEYSFPANGANLRVALENAQRIQDDIESPAQRVLDDVTRALARSADRVLRGHYAKISELISRVDEAKSAADKGATLEGLMTALFEQVSGFTVYDRNLRTETEEIDLVVLNDSRDPLYSRDGPIILVECKNWTAAPGRPEFSILESKIRNRHSRCTIAFLVSWSGFTEPTWRESIRLSRERYVIVCLTGNDVRQAAMAGRFPEYLNQATLRALTR